MLLDSSASASASTADQTDRTSLGRSTRWPYKSYSEKFLAQQDEEKRQCLLAIMEGRPLLLLDDTAPAASTLLLTDGAAHHHHRRVPIDPDADIIPSSSSRSGCNYDDWKSGTTQFENSTCHGGDMATRTTMGESYRSARGSARRGVYGGGVRYFTPDYSLYSESDDDDDDSDQHVSEECRDMDALKEAVNKQGDAIETEGSLGSNMDSASMVIGEEKGAVDDDEEEKGYGVRTSTQLFVKESNKREKKVKKIREKEGKKGKMMNRTRSNNRRRSPLVASNDSSSLSSQS